MKNETLLQWCDSSGKIGLELHSWVVETCAHSGPCDNDIHETRRYCKPIEDQLQALDVASLRACIAEYGASVDLEDVDAMRDFILWVACAECKENPDWYL